MITTRRISRRRFLVGAAALAGVGSAPAVVRAQGASIRLGTLTPLTGAGGNYGPSMRKAMEWVAEQVDAAGGVAGRKLQLFSEDDQTNPEAEVRAAKGGTEIVGSVIYDKDKATFRTEVDQALRAKPDMIYLNGYTPDCTVLLKELYKAGYTGAKIAQGYAVDMKLLAAVPNEVSDGTYTATPSPAVDSPGYKRLAAFLGASEMNPYSCQTHDQISLVALAIAHAKGDATGAAIREHVRKISQGSGQKVDNAVDGLKLLAQGKDVNYEGASGPCDFTEQGDIIDCKIRFDRADKGTFKTLKLL